MSTEVTTAFVKQFGSLVFHLSQQQGSVLRPAVRVESVKGDSRYFDRIGKATAVIRTSRHGDTPQFDTPHSRRMVTLADYHYGDMVDDQDKVRMLIDPTSEYVIAAMWALGRSMDDVIISAASGNAAGGSTGTSSVALPSSQKLVAADSAGTAGAGLNVTALRRAAKILDGNDVAPSIPRYFAFNAYQKEKLLGETEVTSADFNTVRALVMGDIDTFMGFKFLRTERLVDQSGSLAVNFTTGAVGSGGGDADGYDKCLAWAKDGLLLGLGEDIKAEIGKDPGKQFNTRVYCKMSIGAVRMEEEKVVEVLCLDT